ncbi:hypothetical protein [Natrinema salsiterrestre]|uniref:Uncharacterized protein n=1 Tax=Natrinema salsiterrestre TaxID=2950540 RepID=A0A9Q4KYJ4_9EURY|nr:hypothetical protein [Natrinema salsiterrestre]MDF9746365.1 hypothetical protein [Natrinema salsiterrestre]
MVSHTRDRAQLILIGAITLAFIILGIVVVFNGALYTETLSSGGTTQSASNADVVEYEVEQGVSCMLTGVEDDLTGSLTSAPIEENVTEFSQAYQNTTAKSTPTAVNVSLDTTNIISASDIDSVTVIITYDSNSLSYEQEKTIEPEDCPTE